MRRRMTLGWIVALVLATATVGCTDKSRDSTGPEPKQEAKEEPAAEAAKASEAARADEAAKAEEGTKASESGGVKQGAASPDVPGKPTQEPAAQEGAVQSSDAAAKLHSSLLSLAPKGALAVGAVDVEALMRSSASLLDSLLGTQLVWTDTVKDLSELLKTRLGVDPMELKLVGMIAVKKGPLFVVPWTKPLLVPAGAQTKDFDGVSMVRMGPFWVAKHGDWLFAGESGSMKMLLRALKGTEPLMPAEDAALHSEMAKTLGAGMLLLTVDLRMLTPVAQQEIPGVELRSVGVKLDGAKLVIMANLPPASRKLLLTFLETTLSKAKEELARAYKNREEMELLDAAGTILAYHQFGALSETFKPVEQGDCLVLEITGISGAAMPVIGVLSAVAIPAFVKYMRRSKTSEAIYQMDKIYKGAIEYASVPRMDPAAGPLPCQFPPSAKVNGKSCCEFPEGKCPGEASEWEGPTWSALKFQVNEPHYYRYEFTSEGTGTEAKATVTAYGDLDCDGVESTFSRTITMEPAKAEQSGPKATECIPKSGKLFIDNEIE